MRKKYIVYTTATGQLRAINTLMTNKETTYSVNTKRGRIMRKDKYHRIFDTFADAKEFCIERAEAQMEGALVAVKLADEKMNAAKSLKANEVQEVQI